jgi:predicted permease
LVNLSGLSLPGVVADAVGLIATAGLPAALFALGGILTLYRPEGDGRVIAMICAVSLILHPLITAGLGLAFGLDRDPFRSAVLTAAMAPGVNTYLFANMYGAARRVAATSVLVATALSVGTIWVWLLVIP